MVLLVPALMVLVPELLFPPMPMSIGYHRVMGSLSVIGYNVIAFQFQVGDLIR